MPGVAVAAFDRDRAGSRMPPARQLGELLGESSIAQFRAIYAAGGQTLEVQKPLLLGGQQFGSIRVGVSTLLIANDLDSALGSALVTASIALGVATLVAMFLSGLILRPIHVIRSGLSRLGRGEFGVTLDLPQQDEFGELGSFFNTLSAQLSEDRNQRAGQTANLESVVEHLEDAVAIVNPAGEVLFANPAMKATLPADAVGRALDDLLPGGHPYRTLVDETRATGQSRGPVSATITSGAPDGAEEDDAAAGQRLLISHAIRDLNQRLVGVMLVARNLHYLSQVQSTVNYSRKLVALGRLSAGVAHEVKNPLNAMTIHLELLKQKLLATAAGRSGAAPGRSASGADAPSSNSPAALEHVKVIAGEIKRLDEVVQGFLKFTRPDELKLQPVPVSTLIEGVLNVIEPEAKKAGIEVKVDGVDGAPDISGDPAMLRQALLNLALNACQAMPEGGTLRLSAAPASGRRVAIAIEDTGVGIKPEHLGKIFDLYFTTKEGGSGSACRWCIAPSSCTTEVEGSRSRGGRRSACCRRRSSAVPAEGCCIWHNRHVKTFRRWSSWRSRSAWRPARTRRRARSRSGCRSTCRRRRSGSSRRRRPRKRRSSRRSRRTCRAPSRCARARRSRSRSRRRPRSRRPRRRATPRPPARCRPHLPPARSRR
jgi:signal transduction histidine kinase